MTKPSTEPLAELVDELQGRYGNLAPEPAPERFREQLAAILRERELCAKIADTIEIDFDDTPLMVAERIATKIRARSPT